VNETSKKGSGEGRRVLIVAAEAAVGQPLMNLVREHAGERPRSVLVVAPALAGSPFKHAMGDVDSAIATANARLDESLHDLREEGLDVRGTVGDSDPIIAIDDALSQFPADEILLVTHPDDEATWLEDDLFERAKQKFQPEIVHVALARHGNEAEVEDVETQGAGEASPADAEVSAQSRNMPKLSLRDLLGMVVAIVGSIVLVILAGGCEGEAVQRQGGSEGVGTEGACVALYVIAGITVLINIAHVVGLTLFQSVHYRGGLERFFANLSLFGTPLAVVAALLLH
jgi:hypothetical protein